MKGQNSNMNIWLTRLANTGKCQAGNPGTASSPGYLNRSTESHKLLHHAHRCNAAMPPSATHNARSGMHSSTWFAHADKTPDMSSNHHTNKSLDVAESSAHLQCVHVNAALAITCGVTQAAGENQRAISMTLHAHKIITCLRAENALTIQAFQEQLCEMLPHTYSDDKKTLLQETSQQTSVSREAINPDELF